MAVVLFSATGQKLFHGNSTVQQFLTETLEKNQWNPFKEVRGKTDNETPTPTYPSFPHPKDSDNHVFEIRSLIDRDQAEEWCLQEDFNNKKRKNLLIAKVCDDSPSQKWTMDHNGYIRNMGLRNKCIRKAGRYLKFSNCDKQDDPFLKWFILSEDQTIRWSNNVMTTIRVNTKFTTSNFKRKKVASVQLGNVANRGPRSNEKWHVIFDAPPTPSPTMYFSDESEDESEDVDVDVATEFLIDMTMQCLDDSTLNSFLDSTNPLDMLQNYCDMEQESLFEKELSSYEQCSGASISEFVQSIASAVFGGAMTCSPYLFDTFVSFSEQGVPTFPLPRIPEECVNSFLGRNGVGHFMRNEMIMTKKGMACLATLGNSVPDCTLYRWPVPIVGPILKFASCAYPMFEDMFAMSCDYELSVLSSCLPRVSEITDATSDMCSEWIGRCALEDLKYGILPFTGMILPPPLWAPPLNDICHDHSLYYDVSEQYESFRDACIPEEDKKIWVKNIE